MPPSKASKDRPKAELSTLSGYRPRVSVTGTVGEQYQDITTRSNSQGINTYVRSHALTSPYTGGALLGDRIRMQ